MKKQIVAALLLSSALLSSCTLLDKLGFDTYDYMSEEITASLEIEGETAKKIDSMLAILITDSVVLPEFENMGDAIDLYRDAVLRHMLRNGYSKYSGNTALMEKAAKEYPEYQITQMIPADDFEATMYEFFGGDVKISHRDGTLFKYLKKVEAYTCNIDPKDNGIVPQILSIDETDKTYRVRFRCVAEDSAGDEYFALIIKRTDGTHYFKKLLQGVS